MARKTKHEQNKEKAAKQKKIAIVGGVLFAVLLAVQVPRTMKMMHGHAKAPVVATTTPDGTTTTTAAAVADSNSLAAPTLAGAPTTTTAAAADTSNLVAAVPLKVDSGQIANFQRFVSKDPFQAQVSATGASAAGSGKSGSSSSGSTKGGGAASSGGSAPVRITPTAPSAPAPQPAAPTAAVISLNGEVASVPVNSDFPTSGATFDRVGTVFHLISVTAKTAKIAIAGGSYADGSPSITLRLKTPVTLQNTADGSKYTLILEPPDTPVSGGTSTTSTAPATVPAVPSGSGG